jgi:hypothetical protein
VVELKRVWVVVVPDKDPVVTGTGALGRRGVAVTAEVTEELLVVTTTDPIVGTVVEDTFAEVTRVLTLELTVELLAEIDGLIACGVPDVVAEIDGVETGVEEDDFEATVADGPTAAVPLTKSSPAGGSCQYMMRFSRLKLTTTLSSRGHPRTNGPLSSSMTELQHTFFSSTIRSALLIANV